MAKFYTLVLLLILYVPAAICQAQKDSNIRAIEFAQQLDVVRLDTILPNMQFGDWFRHLVGRKVTITWEVNDCGEQTGGPADKDRDFPMCVEARAKLIDGRTVGVMISVGTCGTGLSEKPGIAVMYIEQNGKYTNVKHLSELSDLLTNHILKSIETGIRKAFSDLGPELIIEYPRQSYSLVVKYKTQKYMVHSINKTGAISKEASEEEGPSYKGFILKVWLEETGTPEQAVIPQTLHETYWNTDLNHTAIGTGEQQLHWNLSYGVRTDKNVLEKIQSTIIHIKR